MSFGVCSGGTCFDNFFFYSVVVLYSLFDPQKKKKKKKKRLSKSKKKLLQQKRIDKRDLKLNLMDEEKKKRLLRQLKERKEMIKNGLDENFLLTRGMNKRELNDQLRLERIRKKREKEEENEKRLHKLVLDPATFDRLSVKQNFGNYQVEMVRMFRKIIQEVDDDRSGEIDKNEFMLAIEKIHDHQDELKKAELKHNKRARSSSRNHNGNSKTLVDELADISNSNAESLTRMVDSMFASLDEDASGTISIFELVGVLFPKGKTAVVVGVQLVVSIFSPLFHISFTFAAKDNNKEDIALYLLMNATPRADVSDDDEYTRPVSETVKNELRQLFDIYDTDKSGTLTVDELRNAMSSAFLFESSGTDQPLSSTAAGITTTDFERLILSSDMDGDGVIDFDEWIEMMRHFFEE